MMKRIRVLALLLALLVVLAACGGNGSKKSSKGREAEALECMKSFAAAKTVEEMEKLTTGISQEMEQQWESLLQTGSMPEVAWVKFVETYEGVDVYSVAYLDPNTNQPMSHVGYSGLVWQNGKYLVSADMALQEKLAARYTDCECAAGKVYTPVEPCKTCNGTGMAPGINAEQPVPGGSLQLNPELEIVVPVAPEESLGSVDGNVIQMIPGAEATVDGNVIQIIPGEVGTVDGSAVQITPLPPIEGETVIVKPVQPEGGQVAIIRPDGSIHTEGSVTIEAPEVVPGYISGAIGEADLCPDCKGVAEFKGEDCTDCKGLGLLINK